MVMTFLKVLIPFAFIALISLPAALLFHLHNGGTICDALISHAVTIASIMVMVGIGYFFSSR